MKCQYQNVLDTGSELHIPLKIRTKAYLKKMPGLLALKRELEKGAGKRENEVLIKPDVSVGQQVLNLNPGDWVEIRSADEIRRTLDSKSCFDRTIFMEGMWRYCGRRFQVLKRIEKIIDYRSGKFWGVKNTVIFKGVHCENDPTEFYDCDQNCFYYWKEAWLKRSDPPVAG